MPIIKVKKEKLEESGQRGKSLNLQERILQIDHIQARRFAKLTGLTLEIATEGILRHLKACLKQDALPDASALREIIDDAMNGRKVFAENDTTYQEKNLAA